MRSLNQLHFLQLALMAVPLSYAVVWWRKQPPQKREAVLTIRTLAKVHGVRYVTYERALAGAAAPILREFFTVEAQVDLSTQDPGRHIVVAQLTAELLQPLVQRAQLRPPVLMLHLSKALYGAQFNQPLTGTTLTPFQALLGTLEEAQSQPVDASTEEARYQGSVQFLLHSLEFHQRENSLALQTVKAAYARMVAATA